MQCVSDQIFLKPIAAVHIFDVAFDDRALMIGRTPLQISTNLAAMLPGAARRAITDFNFCKLSRRYVHVSSLEKSSQPYLGYAFVVGAANNVFRELRTALI